MICLFSVALVGATLAASSAVGLDSLYTFSTAARLRVVRG